MQVIRYSQLDRPRPLNSERQRKIQARKRQARRDNLKNILLITALIACFMAAGYLDQQSLQQGLIH